MSIRQRRDTHLLLYCPNLLTDVSPTDVTRKDQSFEFDVPGIKRVA
jgi:hypothetical protein